MMIDIRTIPRVDWGSLTIQNRSFSVFERLLPKYSAGTWAFSEELFAEDAVYEMCFPQEDLVATYDERATVIGAFDGEICVGLAIFTEDDFSYFYLSDIKVDPAYRQQGIGRRLIEQGLLVAQTKGYRGLRTIAQDNNLAACRFYLKHGFEIGGYDNWIYRGTTQEGKADVHFYKDLSVDL